MSIFANKLDELTTTVELGLRSDAVALAKSLGFGKDKICYAVGSGGSIALAHFFARCRSTLGLGPTFIKTPLEFSVEENVIDAEVWFITAGGNNPDILASLQVAINRGEKANVITSAPKSALVDLANAHGIDVHLCPVGISRDGFLSTHSLMAGIVGFLRASDLLQRHGSGNLLDREILSIAQHLLSRSERQNLAVKFRPILGSKLVLILADPRLAAASSLIETCLWEAALYPVQLTDFRNFAHGRHVWPERERNAVLIAMTGTETAGMWHDIRTELSAEVPSITLHYNDCGRIENFKAIIDALGIVEALGEQRAIDPANPGIGGSARAIYNNDGLRRLVTGRTSSMLAKLSAHVARDFSTGRQLDWAKQAQKIRNDLAHASISSVVLDYDGTMILQTDREALPSASIIDEVLRLIDGGLNFAFASGRGGSLGTVLRSFVPESVWPNVLVGYYNGAHLQKLNVDIDKRPPPVDWRIEKLEERLKSRTDLFVSSPKIRNSRVQLSLNVADLRSRKDFIDEFNRTGFGQDSTLQLFDAGKTLDIGTLEANKANVVGKITNDSPPGTGVLCVGDSGGLWGNDHTMLSIPLGICVGDTCDSFESCWPLNLCVKGPSALEILLKCLTIRGHGLAQIDLDMLEDLNDSQLVLQNRYALQDHRHG